MTPLAAWVLSACLVGGGATADTVTTVQTLKQPGRYETNPLFGPHPSTPRVLATKVVLNAPLVLGAYWLAHHDHPRLAVVVSAIGGGSQFGAAIHNITVH